MKDIPEGQAFQQSFREQGYVSSPALATALRLHPFVRHDGPVSIARSFEAQDWRRLLRSADIPADSARVQHWFPFRLCVSRIKAG